MPSRIIPCKELKILRTVAAHFAILRAYAAGLSVSGDGLDIFLSEHKFNHVSVPALE